jgi:acetyltransferase-like isoleucine patch superfamily enzyme
VTLEGVFVHPAALCVSENVGTGTRIWAFTHVLPGARIGSDVNINDNVFVENDVVVGDRVTIKCGVQLWDGVRLGDDVFVGPNATFTNDRMPRSKQYPDRFLETTVEVGASIGANATILPGIRIGRMAMVGAGSVVTHDVPPFAIVVGNPARITGYVGAGTGSDAHQLDSIEQQVRQLGGGARLVPITSATDLRGSLVAFSYPDTVPFPPVRCFTVYDVPTKDVRGEHAHRVCEQFLVCVRGTVSVLVDDGSERDEVRLNDAAVGLYVPAMVWAAQYKYSNDAVLVVLASHEYDADDYIRDYDEFLQLVATG